MANQNLDIVVRVRGGTVASTEIRGVGKAVGSVGTETEQTTKKTSGLSKSLKGLATGFAVYKGYQWIKGAVDATTSLAKSTAGLQRITGLDTTQAAGWVSMAQERGIQSKQLNQSFISLAKNIQSAAAGSKTGKAAFAQLGLDASNLKVQDAQTQMGMLADSFKALPPGVDKASLAQKLFGRQAQAMLPILNQNAGSLNKQIDELGKSSGMNDKNAKSAINLVKQQRELEHAMMGVKVAVGTALTPVLVAATQVLTPLAAGFAKLMQTSPAFRVAIYALVGALTAMLVVSQALKLTTLELTAAWLLIPAAIAAIAVGLIYLYKHCAWFRDAVNAAFGAIKAAVVAVFNWIKANWPLLLTIMLGPIGAAAAAIITHFGAIKKAVSAAFNWIKGAVGTVASAISSGLGGAFSAVKSVVDGVVSAVTTLFNTMNKIKSLPGKALNLLTSNIPFIGGHAAGGTTTQSGVALVGEAGPELVGLPRGSTVTPNHALGGLFSGSVVVPVYLDTRQIALALGDFTAGQQAAR